jgi:sulfur relay (sulfurtransferase) complex TusBCD TusD component (DsrE family)
MSNKLLYASMGIIAIFLLVIGVVIGLALQTPQQIEIPVPQ